MKRFIAIICSLMLCASLVACYNTGSTETSGADFSLSDADDTDTSSNTDASPSEASHDVPSSSGSSSPSSTSSSSSGSSVNANELASLGAYSTGTHHAVATIKGYGQVTIEIYSDLAPRTADFFCNLVQDRYYDGTCIYWILNKMYLKFGDRSRKTQGDYSIKGEYADAGTDNDLSLKRATIAMARTKNGKGSDATELIVYLSDCSYLDGKYAAFAKITDGMDYIDKMCSKINTGQKDTEIVVNGKGKILNKSQCPVIKKIRMVD